MRGRGQNGGMHTPRDPLPRFLAPAQVAELLCIEIDEVVALILAGHLRGAQLGAPPRWRIEEDSLEDYLSAQREEARLMALWHQANQASFPEVWGVATPHG